MHRITNSVYDVDESRSSWEALANPHLLEFGDVFLRQNPSHEDRDIGATDIREPIDEVLAEYEVGVGHHRCRDDINILIAC